jgi:hypothetical protein
MLSKSKITRGLQCQKSLWLYKNQPELRGKISDSQQAIFDSGTNVGLLAQQKFSGGIDATDGHDWPNFECADTTKYLIGIDQKVIYEATFVFNKVLVAVDILVKNEEGSWDAYEVKSTNSAKEAHITDSAIQYYVMEGCGITLRSMSVMHFDRDYVRQGDLDIKQLFMATDITTEVRDLQADMAVIVTELEAMQKQAKCPEVEIGSHCSNPYPCDFASHCWKEVPDYSVFNLTRGGARSWELYNRGITLIADIPIEDVDIMSDNQRIQHLADLTGEPHIIQEGVKSFVDQLQYPLYHFDFETMMPAIPLFDNTRTYQQLPFQYSVHIQDSVGVDPEHKEYLAATQEGVMGADPREPLILQMLQDLGTVGTILAYHASFEITQIKALARDFSAYEMPLLALLPRFIDLRKPFSMRVYYHPEFKGSTSIKYVLPALVPKLSYQDLEIQEGGTASATFLAMHKGVYDGDYEAAREHLIEYCKLDTYAMVKLLEVLYTV